MRLLMKENKLKLLDKQLLHSIYYSILFGIVFVTSILIFFSVTDEGVPVLITLIFFGYLVYIVISLLLTLYIISEHHKRHKAVWYILLYWFITFSLFIGSGIIIFINV